MKSRKMIEGSGKFSGGRFRPVTPRKGSWADQEASRPKQPITPEEERMRRAGRSHPGAQAPQARADGARAGRPNKMLDLLRGADDLVEAGEWGPSPQRPRQFVAVTFADGNVVRTSVNGTEAEVRAYYAIGREFNLGPMGGSKDDMQKVTKVEFPNRVIPSSDGPARVIEATSASLFSEIEAAGIDHDSHESDLYLPDTPEVRAILRRHPEEAARATPFKHQVNGQRWLDVPFAYAPWWARRQERSGGADDYGEPVGPEGLRRFRTCEPGEGGGDPAGCPDPRSTSAVLLGRSGYDKWAADMRGRGQAVPSWEEGAPHGAEAAEPRSVVARLIEADGSERRDLGRPMEEMPDVPRKSWDAHQAGEGWQKVFPDFREADIPPEVLEGVRSGALVDVSSVADGTPGFALADSWGPDESAQRDQAPVLFVQAADPIRRFDPDGKRYQVVLDDLVQLDTDDPAAALAELRGYAERGRAAGGPKEGPSGADDGQAGDEALREGALRVVETLLEDDDFHAPERYARRTRRFKEDTDESFQARVRKAESHGLEAMEDDELTPEGLRDKRRAMREGGSEAEPRAVVCPTCRGHVGDDMGPPKCSCRRDKYQMSDQPAACPKCGARIQAWLAGEDGPVQIVRCEPCDYEFELYSDEDEPGGGGKALP